MMLHVCSLFAKIGCLRSCFWAIKKTALSLKYGDQALFLAVYGIYVQTLVMKSLLVLKKNAEWIEHQLFDYLLT